MGEIANLSSAAITEAVSDALRRHVGPGKAVSLDELSERTHIARRTLDAYRGGEYAMPLAAALNIAHALDDLGPSFINEVLSLAGLGGCERLTAGKLDPHALMADTAGLTMQVAELLRDGKLCHRDRAILSRALDALIPKLEEQRNAMRESPLRSVS